MKQELSSEKSTKRYNRRPAAYVGTTELAKLMGVTPARIRQHIADGTLPPSAGVAKLEGSLGRPGHIWLRSRVARFIEGARS